MNSKKGLELFSKELAFINTHLLIIKKFGEAMKRNDLWFIGNYPYFIFTFTAHTHSVLIGMRKFFDKDKRSLSLYSIIESIDDETKQNEYSKKICSLFVDFSFYEKFANKIIAHLDRQEQTISATIPSLDFLDESKLPRLMSDLINLVRELKLYFNDKDYVVPEYIGTINTLNSIIACLNRCGKENSISL